ncbi:hypothetical protein AAC387_Pa06g3232 [Persea americana]
MSLMENGIEVLSGQPNCQHLLTLLLQYNPLEKISPDSYFDHMCSLRVLNLSSTKIKSLPDSVSNLKQLRALILYWCIDLEKVPSLEKLKKLRVLDLSYTNIQELPSGVEAMVYLERLHLDGTNELRVIPAGIIPRLSHLEELTMHQSRWKWSSTTREGAGIEEIINSTRLAILKIHFKELSDFLPLYSLQANPTVQIRPSEPISTVRSRSRHKGRRDHELRWARSPPGPGGRKPQSRRRRCPDKDRGNSSKPGRYVTEKGIVSVGKNVTRRTVGDEVGAEGNFIFIKDAVYKKPDISLLPFPTHFIPSDEDTSELEPLVADLGEIDPFMTAD